MEKNVAKNSTMRLWVMGDSKSRRGVTKSTQNDAFGLRNLPMEADREQSDVFYTNMAPVLQILRAIGALPIPTLPVDRNASSGN
jgi:hypothetical protein